MNMDEQVSHQKDSRNTNKRVWSIQQNISVRMFIVLRLIVILLIRMYTHHVCLVPSEVRGGPWIYWLEIQVAMGCHVDSDNRSLLFKSKKKMFLPDKRDFPKLKDSVQQRKVNGRNLYTSGIIAYCTSKKQISRRHESSRNRTEQITQQNGLCI